jgi:hypothetical protein
MDLLPNEVLAKILRLLLAYDYPIVIDYSSDNSCSPSVKNLAPGVSSTIRICRYLHNLAVHILYSQNKFEFLDVFCGTDVPLFLSTLSDVGYKSLTRLLINLPETPKNFRPMLHYLSCCQSLRALEVWCGGGIIKDFD